MGLLLDLDECAVNNGGCAQICSNTEGSFTCSCNPESTLASNGRDCGTQLCSYIINASRLKLCYGVSIGYDPSMFGIMYHAQIVAPLKSHSFP